MRGLDNRGIAECVEKRGSNIIPESRLSSREEKRLTQKGIHIKPMIDKKNRIEKWIFLPMMDNGRCRKRLRTSGGSCGIVTNEKTAGD